MTSPTPAPDQVSAAEIARLLAWARSLSDAGPAVNPAERAAFLAAKTALLTRVADQHADAASAQRTSSD